MSKHFKYRPEIDGLRTIAVLAVLVFHGEFEYRGTPIFQGGYLGVDVFFVISGYLITSIVYLRLQNNTFTIGDFYSRRIRRILPIFYTVSLACLPFAWLYMMPSEMVDFAHSGLSSLVFGSNFWFWQEDPYWAAEAILKPLQHTWSLAVEEQFYVIWPVLLLLSWKRSRALQIALFSLIVLGSLGLAEWTARIKPELGFYLLPTRLWELGAGGVLAILELRYPRQNTSRSISRLTPTLGLLLILYPMWVFNHETLHPSLLTAIPVVGTILILRFASATSPDPTSIFLRSRPMVWLGLRSYGLYLWHFPILAFAHIALGDIDAATTCGLLFASLIVTAITYVIVEQPCRDRARVSNKSIIIGIVIANIALGAFYMKARDGMTERAEDVFQYVFAKKRHDQLKDRRGGCQYRMCEFESDTATARIILAGDSHARMLGPGIHRHGIQDFSITTAYSRCFTPPHTTFAPVKKETGGYRRCVEFAEEFAGFITTVTDSTVIFSARITKILAGRGFNNQEGGNETEKSMARISTNELTYKENIAAMFETIIANGNILVLVYPVPEAGWNVPGKIKKELRGIPVGMYGQYLQDISISTSRDLYFERNSKTFEIFDQIQGDNVIRVYPHALFCDTERCFNTRGEKILYIDDDHLTPYAADLLGQQIVEQISGHTRN